MNSFHFLAGYIIFVALPLSCFAQNLQSGVDLVTSLSNSIIPSVFKGLSLSTDDENIVIGPFGLLSNLAMILEASDGKTKQEILRSLKISKEHLSDLRTGFKAYCDLFVNELCVTESSAVIDVVGMVEMRGHLTLDTTAQDHASEQEAAGSFNSAAVTSSFHLDAAYKRTLSRNYCANISESNSFNESAVELKSDAGVMSHWKDYEKLAVYTFLSHQSLMPFLKRSKGSVLVPMIPQVGLFKNARWEKSQLIVLPLQAKFVHLLLVVPDEVGGFDGLMTKLLNQNLPNLVESLPKSEMEVFIPQLTAVSKNLNISDILVRSGIRQAFDQKKANLTKASDNSNSSVYIKSITQNAYFSTSFVALNSVSGTSVSFGASRRKRDTAKFYVDRPFMFLLLHKSTQLALLAGKIGNPVQVPS